MLFVVRKSVCINLVSKRLLSCPVGSLDDQKRLIGGVITVQGAKRGAARHARTKSSRRGWGELGSTALFVEDFQICWDEVNHDPSIH